MSGKVCKKVCKVECSVVPKSVKKSRSRSPSPSPAKDGKIPACGSRAQVLHGKARHTSGGLTASDLAMNNRGRIVSVKKSITAKELFNKPNSVIRKNMKTKRQMAVLRKMIKHRATGPRKTPCGRKRK